MMESLKTGLHRGHICTFYDVLDWKESSHGGNAQTQQGRKSRACICPRQFQKSRNILDSRVSCNERAQTQVPEEAEGLASPFPGTAPRILQCIRLQIKLPYKRKGQTMSSLATIRQIHQCTGLEMKRPARIAVIGPSKPSSVTVPQILQGISLQREAMGIARPVPQQCLKVRDCAQLGLLQEYCNKHPWRVRSFTRTKSTAPACAQGSSKSSPKPKFLLISKLLI